MTEEEKPIRVVDRRMFTAEGELRPGFEAEEPPPQAPPEASKPPAAERPPGPRRGPDARPDAPRPRPAAGPPSEMLEIIRSLATTAYAALGLVPDPSGTQRREPGVARQMIDWLAVLEQKTQGNLSFEESDLLGRVLYELRMAFVETMGPPGQEPKR